MIGIIRCLYGVLFCALFCSLRASEISTQRTVVRSGKKYCTSLLYPCMLLRKAFAPNKSLARTDLPQVVEDNIADFLPSMYLAPFENVLISDRPLKTPRDMSAIALALVCTRVGWPSCSRRSMHIRDTLKSILPCDLYNIVLGYTLSKPWELFQLHFAKPHPNACVLFQEWVKYYFNYEDTDKEAKDKFNKQLDICLKEGKRGLSARALSTVSFLCGSLMSMLKSNMLMAKESGTIWEYVTSPSHLLIDYGDDMSGSSSYTPRSMVLDIVSSMFMLPSCDSHTGQPLHIIIPPGGHDFMKVSSVVQYNKKWSYAFIVALAVEHEQPSQEPLLLTPSSPFQPNIFGVWKRNKTTNNLQFAGNTSLPAFGHRRTPVLNEKSLRPFLLAYRRIDKSNCKAGLQESYPHVEPSVSRASPSLATTYQQVKSPIVPQSTQELEQERSACFRAETSFEDKISRRLSPLSPSIAKHLHIHRIKSLRHRI